MIRNNFVDLINENNYKFIVEVGVQHGNFSSILLNSNLEKLYLIDSWRYLENYDDVANTSNEEQEAIYQQVKYKFYKNNRIEIIRKLSLEACSSFKDGSLDFVYLDADHSYAGIKEDLKNWFNKVRIGGILSGHDYLDGKIDAGDFGVKTAVDEFVKEKKLKLLLTDESEWKSWYIFKE